MSDLIPEYEVIAQVSSLTRERLVSYCEARIVVPINSVNGPVYRRLDVARLELACDLHEQYEMETEALGLVLSLVDQLHGVRAEMREIMRAIEGMPDPICQELARVLEQSRATRD